MTQTEAHLIGVTTRDFTFHAGPHAKHVPAGTEVMIRAEAVAEGRRYALVRVVGRPRVSEVIAVSCVVPA